MSDTICDLYATWKEHAKGCSGNGGKGAKWWSEHHAVRRAEYVRLRAQGLTYQAIGDIFGVTGQAVRLGVMKEAALNGIDPVLRKAQLEALGVTYSRQHLWNLERSGHFPQRVQLGPRSHGWRQSEIAAWLAGRPRAALKTPVEEPPVRSDGMAAYRKQLREFTL